MSNVVVVKSPAWSERDAALRLHKAVCAICPIEGVSIGASAVRIDFRPEATEEQRVAAVAVTEAFDPEAPDEAATERKRRADEYARKIAGTELEAFLQDRFGLS